jgi:hypothetical protein
MNFYWLNVFDHVFDLSQLGLFCLDEADEQKCFQLSAKESYYRITWVRAKIDILFVRLLYVSSSSGFRWLAGDGW